MKTRSLGRWALALLSAWFVFAGYLCLVTFYGTAGIFNELLTGGPVWICAVPLLGVVGVVAALRPRPGAYWLLAVLAISQVLLAFGTITALDDYGLPVSWAAGLGIPLSILYAAIALQMAFDDAPPLRSLISRVAYLGRRNHLLDLLQMAKRWGWKASGPESPNLAVRVAGEWAGRELHMESGAVYHLGIANASHYYLSIAVRSKRNLWPLMLAVGVEGPKSSQRKTAVKGKCRNAQGRSSTFYVWPPDTRPAEDVDVTALTAALESGKEWLGARTTLNAAGESVWFGRQDTFQMPLTGEDVEAIIRWLDAITGVMEKFHSEGPEVVSSGGS